jgi:large subunit ribosomal protein L22
VEARAVAKYIRISPRKMKPITDLVRGKNANEAIAILKFTPRKGAGLLKKVLESAVANAENNYGMDIDNLYVSEVYANQGPTMKRWKAGSMGRANPILRRTSHLGVVLKEKE